MKTYRAVRLLTALTLTSLAGAASCSSDGSGSTGGNGGTGGSGGGDTCAAPQCTADYCSSLHDWCSWTRQHNYQDSSWSDGATSCGQCVEYYDNLAEQLPLGYCAAMFYCWDNCIAQHGSEGNDAVHTCNVDYCNSLCS